MVQGLRVGGVRRTTICTECHRLGLSVIACGLAAESRPRVTIAAGIHCEPVEYGTQVAGDMMPGGDGVTA